MNHTLHILIILFYLSTSSAFSQLFHKRGPNALLPQNCYIKHLYNFPYHSSTIFYSEKFPDLEKREYENTEFIKPLFDEVFSGNHQVYSPNFWGSVEDLIQTGPPGFIDTNGILLYMRAGWDTAFSINENNQFTLIPFYTPPDYKEISGIFFFESWHLSSDKGFLEKNVIAYLPVREYWDEYSLEEGEAIRQKRLIFMVYPGEEKSNTTLSRSMKKQKDLLLIYRGIEHELELYNRPYYEYIYRDKTATDIRDEEYDKWGYHTFDFYRYFDADRFLRAIIRLILNGKLRTVDPYDFNLKLNKEEIILRIGDISFDNDALERQTIVQHDNIMYDNLNSVVFNEDWYFEPGSLKIYKKVNNMTIVKHDIQYDEYTGNFLREVKTPVITVVF